MRCDRRKLTYADAEVALALARGAVRNLIVARTVRSKKTASVRGCVATKGRSVFVGKDFERRNFVKELRNQSFCDEQVG